MKIYVDANWNGTDAAPDGFDAIYKTLGDAVRGSSTSEKTVITVAGGTYDDSVAFLTDDFVISQAAKDHKRYPADVGATIESATRAGAQKADIEFVAAEGAEVKFTGNFVMGFNFSGSPDTQEWTNGVFFTGITFESASGRPNIVLSDVGDFAATDCVFNGKGEYGIDGTTNSSVTKAVSVTSCTFNNSGIQAIGGVGTNMEISDCTFTESNVNATGGAENGVSITDCTFNLTLTDAHVGDSFYAVRNQSSTPVSISGCEFNIDSDLASVAADQETWGIFYQRGNAENWSVDSVEINLTENALAQTELLTVKNTIPGETLAIDGITSSNDVSSLLSRSEGLLNVSADGKYAMYADGVLQQEVDLSTLYVDASFSSGNTGEGKIFGVNAFADINAGVETAGQAAVDGDVKLVVQEDSVSSYTDNYVLMNVAFSEDYYDTAATSGTYALDVQGVLNSYHIIINSNVMDVSGTVITAEDVRVYGEGGVINFNGDRAAGVVYTLNDLLHDGNGNPLGGFGGPNITPTENVQIKAATIKVKEDGVMNFNNADAVLSCSGNVFAIIGYDESAGTVNMTDSYIHVISTGGYGNPVSMEIGADGELNMTDSVITSIPSELSLIINNFGAINATGESSIDGTLTNAGTLTVAGGSFSVDTYIDATPKAQFIVNGEATLKIDSLNGTIVLNDEAVLSADTSITGSMGSLRAVDADIVAGGTYNTVTFEVDGILNVTGVDLTDVYTVGSNSSISLEEGGVLAFNESNVVWDDETTGTILSEGIIYSVTAIDDPISYGYGLESFAFAATEEVYTALKGDLTVTQGEGTYTFTAAFATTGGAGDVLYEIDSIRVGETVLEEGVDYTMDGMSFTLKNNGPADLVITVEAEDQYGEASEINGSVTLAVKDYTDPVFASALTPDTTEQAESVTFVASEVADNFGVVSYSYTFNGETKEWKAGESVTVTENGLFTVLAKDAAGNTATQTYEVTNIVIPEVPVIPEEPVVPVAPSGPVNVLVVTPGNTHEYHGEDVVMPEGQSIAAILNTKSEAMNLEVGVLGKAGEGVTDLMLGYGVNMEIQKEFQNPGSINIGFNSSLKVEGNVSAEGSFKSLMVGSGSSVEVNGDVSGYSFLSAGTNGSFVADNVTGTASGMDLFSAGYGAEVDVKDISGVGTLVFGGNNDVYAGDISGVRNMILGYGSELDAGTVQFDGDYSMLALAGNNFVSVEELDGLKNLFVGSGSKIEFVYNGEEDLDLSGIAGNWDFAELEDCRGVLAGGSVEGATYGNELDTFVASGSLSFEFDSESTKVMYAAWNEAEEDFSDWTVLESGSTLADGDYLIGAASLDGKGKTKGNYSFDVTIA